VASAYVTACYSASAGGAKLEAELQPSPARHVDAAVGLGSVSDWFPLLTFATFAGSSHSPLLCSRATQSHSGACAIAIVTTLPASPFLQASLTEGRKRQKAIRSVSSAPKHARYCIVRPRWFRICCGAAHGRWSETDGIHENHFSW